MKKVFFIAAFILSTIATVFAQVNPNHVYVNGYTKSNGTYVQGHYRTAPNYTINDNFSTYPNVNPYTGKVGTVYPTNFYTPTPSFSNFSPSFYTPAPSFSGYTPGSLNNSYYKSLYK